MSDPFCRALALLVLLLIAPELRATCLPDPPSDDATVVCDGVDSTGYDASGATNVTITTLGAAVLDDSNPGLDSAILVGNGSQVTIGSAANLFVTEAFGYGIRGNNDNFVDNRGTITINGADGRGISLNLNTTNVLPNGAVNSSLIDALGLRSFALETGNDSGVANLGTLNLTGNQSRGISAANLTDPELQANVSNSGTINVTGIGAFGIRAGDGWVEGRIQSGKIVPTNVGIFNARVDPLGITPTINVDGVGAYGLFAGDTTNLLFNNNDLILAGGIINVNGTDAVGVSMGGNDFLVPYDPLADPATQFFSHEQNGTINGSANAGPLLEFRGAFAGTENSVLVRRTGKLLADLSLQGTPDRAIAIRGTDGDDVVVNLGEIRGDIEFGNGHNRYAQAQNAISSGNLRGGSGVDELLLLDFGVQAAPSFDVSRLSNFDRIAIYGDTGWQLTNTAGFAAPTEIMPGGRLQVPLPITLGGDLVVNPGATVDATLDGISTPLTVLGASSLNGSLVVRQIPGATVAASTTPYRVLMASGGYSGVFADFEFPGKLGIQRLTPSYDAMGVVVLVEQGLVLVANGANQRAIAQHLSDVDAAGGASPDLQNLIDELTTATENLSGVYQTLSPEVYDVHTTVVVEGGRRVTNLLLDRPRECEAGELEPWRNPATPLACHPRTWSPWVAAIGGFRDRKKNGDHPRYDAQIGGLVVGIDGQPIDDVDLTFAISSQRGKLNAAGAGEATVTLTDISAMAGWTVGAVRVQGVASWGHGFHRDLRLIQEDQTTTALDSRGTTSHDSDRISLAGELGYAFDVGPIKLEPIAGVDWAFVDQRAIHETTAGGFGIRIAQRDDSVGSVNAGLRLSTVYQHSRYLLPQLEWMDGVWRPMLDLRWREMLAGDKREIDARFQGSPDAVADFTIKGEEDSGGAELGLGVNFIPKYANRLQFDLRYEAYVAPQTVEHDLFARVLIGF